MNYWSDGIRHIQKIDPTFQNYGIKKKILNINTLQIQNKIVRNRSAGGQQ